MRKLKDYCYCIYDIKKDENDKIIKDTNIGVFDSLKEVGDCLGIKGEYLRSYMSRKDLINGRYEVIKIDLSMEV